MKPPYSEALPCASYSVGHAKNAREVHGRVHARGDSVSNCGDKYVIEGEKIPISNKVC